MEPLKRHRQDEGLHEHEETTIRTGTTKRSRPLSRQEGLQDLKEMDARSEESSLTAATSQQGQLTEMGTASCGDWQEVIYRKNEIQPYHKEKIVGYENQIVNVNSFNSRKPVSSFQQGQLARPRNARGEDWQKETYEKIKSMHDMYCLELEEMYWRLTAKLQKHDARPQQTPNEKLEKARSFKVRLERLITYLQTNKNEIRPLHKEHVGSVEKDTVYIINWGRSQKPATHPQQQQPRTSRMHPNNGRMNSDAQSSSKIPYVYFNRSR